ncbi:diguanylate cyclase [Bacillus salacetis]|uniref:histidine kinase N-terminal 7TM domain-containing diguanylate cyclase n=1 Tax=Bacillus salacetis TaxID=2315464 RepID=UPI003BA3261B
MNSELTAYISLICTSFVFNLYLCSYVFLRRHRYKDIAPLFILHALFTAIYCFGTAFSLMSTTLAEIKLWTVILLAGMLFSTTLGLMFIMKYLGKKLTVKSYIILLAIPLISVILAATNDFHHLYYRTYEIHPDLGAPFVHQEIGIWYMVQGIYTFGSLFVAFLLAFSRWRETAKEYRPQLLALMWGQLVPIITAFVYLMGLTPQGVDPVPMVLWLTSLLYFWSISSSRMFSLMPIAKDAIFNSINDGVVVLDETNRVIEFNQASQIMFPQLTKNMLGEDFLKVWESFTGEPFPFSLKNNVCTYELEHMAGDQSLRTYQVRITELHQPSQRKGLLIIFNDMTEVKDLHDKLEKLAYYDELTGILNRRAFFQKCVREFEEAREEGHPFSVILMDVDHFKRVNDTYGHFVGDQLLVHVIQSCQSQLTNGELFARYGGEEFVLGLKGAAEAEAEKLADRIRTFLAGQHLMTNDGVISATLSLGVAQSTAEGEETLFDLLNKADKALYSAKNAGRNKVHVYKEEKIAL